jgi:hypothetical protein
MTADRDDPQQKVQSQSQYPCSDPYSAYLYSAAPLESIRCRQNVLETAAVGTAELCYHSGYRVLAGDRAYQATPVGSPAMAFSLLSGPALQAVV